MVNSGLWQRTQKRINFFKCNNQIQCCQLMTSSHQFHSIASDFKSKLFLLWCPYQQLSSCYARSKYLGQVECRKQSEASVTSWSFTASISILSYLDLVLSQTREWGWQYTTFLHFKQRHSISQQLPLIKAWWSPLLQWMSMIWSKR